MIHEVEIEVDPLRRVTGSDAMRLVGVSRLEFRPGVADLHTVDRLDGDAADRVGARREEEVGVVGRFDGTGVIDELQPAPVVRRHHISGAVRLLLDGGDPQ
jgi:hypothetical protein